MLKINSFISHINNSHSVSGYYEVIDSWLDIWGAQWNLPTLDILEFQYILELHILYYLIPRVALFPILLSLILCF